MKKFKKLTIMITTICIFLMINTTSFALEGDFSYYGYDESGGIYDFSLMEENAQIFEGITGIRPFILVTPYLGDYSTAKEYAEDFYNDKDNFDEIFKNANYFIIVISDEEEEMDIFVSPNATSTLTSDIVLNLLYTYGDTIDNTEYYDVTIFDLLTDAQEIILSRKNSIYTPIKNNVDIVNEEPVKIENNNTNNDDIKQVQQNTEHTSTQSEENNSILKYFIILALIIGAIGTIITKITLSFIHKRRKSEEEFELELERLNRSKNIDINPEPERVNLANSVYTFDTDNTKYTTKEKDFDTDDIEETVNNTYNNNSSTITNVTNVYPTETTHRPVGIVPPLPPRRVINTDISSHRPEPMYNTPPMGSSVPHHSMKKPSTPPTQPNTQMKKPTMPTTRSSSFSSNTTMRKPSTPPRRVNRPSAMRRPTTPPRRGR